MDFITGEKFKEIANSVFTPNEIARDDYYKYPNTFNIEGNKLGDIIYTHTMYIPELFKILFFINGDFIVISHNSDVNIGEIEIPGSVKKWYSTNVNYKHPKLESIPIGIENDRWMKKVDKKWFMIQQHIKKRDNKNLVYMNHNISTNPIKRLNLYQMFENKRWVTSERGKNGNDFAQYIGQMYSHKFMVCPEGNGMDTHRMWECLYMGTIPIVKKSINNSFYVDLPICFVDDWDDVTKSFLESEYDRIQNISWDKEKLTFNYWENKIKNN